MIFVVILIFVGGAVVIGFFLRGPSTDSAFVPKFEQKTPTLNTILILEAKKTTEISLERIQDDTMYKDYGARASETFVKKPGLVLHLRSIDPTFTTESMSTSFINVVFKGTKGPLLVISGCIAKNCRGNLSIVVYSGVDRKIYLLRERDPTADIALYGNPQKEIKQLLLYVFSSLKQ